MTKLHAVEGRVEGGATLAAALLHGTLEDTETTAEVLDACRGVSEGPESTFAEARRQAEEIIFSS